MTKSQEQRNNYIAEINEEYEILNDTTRTGKDRKWKERKMGSIRFSERLIKLGYKESVVERVRTCGDVLKFVKDPVQGLKLYQAYFCKNKLCPMCNWRRSMKYSWQIKQILDKALEQYPKARFLFLTLTPTYFKGSENYISQADWTEMWEESAKLDYTPVVNIKAVKEKVAREDLHDDFSEDGIMKAVLETAKYPVKPFEIERDKHGKVIERSEEKLTQITGELLDGLYKKRQLGFGGLLKELRKELHLDDIENGDLVNTSDEKTEPTAGEQIVAYWNYARGNYFIKQ